MSFVMRLFGFLSAMSITPVLSQDNCMSAPCLNGAVCESYQDTYLCMCSGQYTGANCEQLISGSISVDQGFAVDPGFVVDPLPVIGGGADENGCFADGGFEWCESSQSCIRAWETPCDDTVFSQNIDMTIPENCLEWYDGCNRCSVSNGLLELCSMMMCFTQSTPECLSYKLLEEGDTCYQFCEDNSGSSINLQSSCPSGTTCTAPDTMGFDSCGETAWKCVSSH